MIKNLIIINILLCVSTTFGGGMIWNAENLRKQDKESKFFFLGKIKSYTKSFYFIDEKTKKETTLKKDEALKLYQTAFNGAVIPRLMFRIKAKIEVLTVLKGELKKGLVIDYEWNDLHDSMCPHSETLALDFKKCIWFDDLGHSEETPNLSMMPLKHEAKLKIAFEENKKEALELQKKHKKKVEDLIKSLDKKLSDDEMFDNLFEMAELDDPEIEEAIIKKLRIFKGNKDALDDLVFALVEILYRKKKLKSFKPVIFPDSVQKVYSEYMKDYEE